MITIKQISIISIEKCPYYLFDNMINDIKKFDPNLLNIWQISFKSIDAAAYHIKYIKMKSLDHVNIDSPNSLYLDFYNRDGYTGESNGNKY